MPLDDYKTLLNATPSPALLAHELFSEYYKAFEKLNEIKKLKVAKQFKALNLAAQTAELNKRFAQYASQIEQEKLYYYLLANSQKHPVLVFNSPEKAVLKKFLGYDWSTRKGAEGIKYFTQSTPAPVKDDVEGMDDAIADQAEDEDQRVLKNMNALSHINTMLYNAQSSDHTGKLCDLVRNAFLGEAITIPENMQQHASVINLVDMLDFSRVKFEKVITLSSKKIADVKSKWMLKPLEQIIAKVIGNITKIPKKEILLTGKNPVVTQEQDKIISGYTNNSNLITDLPLIVFGDHSCTVKYMDIPFVRGADGTQLIKLAPNSGVELKFLCEFLKNCDIPNKNKYERHFKHLKTLKIPLPPPEVQQKIINECEAIDNDMTLSMQSTSLKQAVMQKYL